MLIQPIPEAELRPAAPRARTEPEATRRPATAAPGQDRFYDASGPGLPRLQKANEALAGFPVDRAGFVDWVAALGEKLIAPRAGVGAVPAPAPHDLDVVMRNTKEMPWVRFPHLAHSQWLDCANCHPAPFAGKAGAGAITMERIFRGQACGMCHGKVAFPAWNQCERCHSIAGPASTGSPGRPQ
jgi:c(7)-type cytochrome triheme protein